jgi:glycosyltransferase involved in cell wall biosynthesis
LNIAIATPEFVSEKTFDGGLANYTYKLAKWLLSQGHSVVVYISSQETTDNAADFEYEGIKIIRLKNKDYAWFLKYYLKKIGLGFLVTKKLKYKIQFRQYAYLLNKKIETDHRIRKIDIIHYPHLGGFAYYRPKQIPAMVRLSSSTDLCQKMGGYESSDLQVGILVKFEIAAMKKADAVFGPSKMIAALTEPLIGKKINIIETPYIKPSEALDYRVYENVLKGKKYILFFGSIGLIKGIGTIAEIIEPLLKKHTDLHYVFVGKQLNNSIQGIDAWDYLVKKAGLFSDRVIHIPSQKHSTLFPIILNAELITLPSRTDNFPNTCIESMANKKIVIGTTGNGFDQLINDGENGFIIDVDDHDALLNKINEVLNLTPDKKQEIENKAFERSKALNPDIVLNSLMELYKKTIKEFKR